LLSPRNENLLSEAEQKYYKKRNLINFLKKDNEDMELTLRIITTQNSKYKEELEQQEREIMEAEENLIALKKDIKRKDEQIQLLRREDQDPQVRESEKKVKAELEKVKSEKKQFEDQIRQREEEIQKLKSKIEDERRNHEDLLEKDKKEKNRLRKEIEDIKKKMNRGFDQLSEQNVSEEDDSHSHKERVPQNQHDEEQRDQPDPQDGHHQLQQEHLHSHHEDHEDQDSDLSDGEKHIHMNEEEKHRMEEDRAAEIKKDEEEKDRRIAEQIQREKQMKAIGKELRYILRAAAIEPADLDSALINKREISDNRIPLQYLVVKLEGEPFKIYDEDKKQLILEYIRQESGSKEHYTTQEILAPLKELIGRYRLLNEAEEKAAIAAITKVASTDQKYFTQNRSQLMSSFEKSFPVSKEQQPVCSEDELKKALLHQDILMSAEDHEFVVLQLFKLSQRIDMLQYKLLFSIFSMNDSRAQTQTQGAGNHELLDISAEGLDDDDLLDQY